MRKIFLVYPCGKKMELRLPIMITSNNKIKYVTPGDDEYIKYAKDRFQINNLKVIEEEVQETKQVDTEFIILSKKTYSIE